MTSSKTLLKAVVGNGTGYLTVCHTDHPKLMGLKTEFYHSSEIDKLLDSVDKYKNSQVFFGLSLQKTIARDGGRGTRENVGSISIIGMDIDTCESKDAKGKLPENKQEAMELLQNFSLKPSIIVDSGRGLHAYWILSETLEIASEADRESAQDFIRNFYAGFAEYAHPMQFDSTFDLTRILRLPGSLNLKKPEAPLLVDIVYEDLSRTYTLDDIRKVSSEKKKERSKSITILESGVQPDLIGKAKLNLIHHGCSWFSRVWSQPEKATYSEWFAVGSVLFFVQDGHQKFHEWSSKYPGYSFDETEDLWDQIDPERARRTCENISTSVSDINECNSCPFKGGVRSPVELGIPGKRVVVTNAGFLPDKSAQAWAATYVNNEPPTLFQTNAGIARINHQDAKWEVVNSKSARHSFARKADWMKTSKDGLQPTDPHENIIEDMLQTQNPPLPYLKQVTSIPVITKDGRLVSNYGYDSDSQIFRVRSSNLAGINYGTNENFASAEEAANFIFNEALVDFPFGSQQDKAHALALMLHDFVRPQFSGPSPLFLLDKPLAGSGASLLATALCYPSLGYPVPMKVFSSHEDELRKQVTTHLYSGGGAYMMDNISGENIDSDVLASVLTSNYFSDRLLGGNIAVKLENLGPWIGTGNNPSFSGQLSRRFIRVRLVPDTDTPHLREGFRHSPLVPWLHENRALLVDACITIVMSWIKAGRPIWTGTPLGSFEEFSKVLGGVVSHAGVSGFMSDMAYQRDSLDAETMQIRDLMQTIWEAKGESAFTTKDIISIASEADLDVQEHWVDPGHHFELTRSELTKAGRFVNNKVDRYFTIYVDGKPLSVQMVKGTSRGTYRLKA